MAGEFVFILVFVALVVGAIVLVWRHEKKRRERFAQEAARLGLVYEHHSTEHLPEVFRQFSVFNQGFARRGLNVLRGTYRGVDVRLFEFQYKTQTHNGKNTQTQTHHVGVALALLGRAHPQVKIVPETFGHKLWDAVGGDDIDFESDEFSRKFWVKAEDRRAAYDLIHARMMEFLMAGAWSSWEIVTPGVLAWSRGRLRPEDAQRHLDLLVGFVALMPPPRAPAAAPPATPTWSAA